ncbi:low-specificity L-threonine aldolase [Vibrio natriegens]|uniref:Low-specificity L-threonine aldolase n=1 Tax=Vibrio natriegens NBRC 15636 = ATCC 14048 = DSM 759 TaxID=1219067 RepID=A0AAN0Y5X7_VIBNA|nr:low-specificity L-threonine aldolase [Vibrio natriegens]ALR18260.1 threonine aldolase [Vibrio natriegens NBRC 15636 = ATCC 14048 = DSM 759]ANQ14208.1 low-specificity L-threonine aldolase [Vibrio natriegens NBRC 15636 = ATCC 14048 = DSM 759]EPM40245.1 threonine aldolase [Vibrio natriegens NBRC 15636 = ATCC 14048 = DSM 759]MDX6028853.1 low-specificity L-threonine aldolase [Vibrio natriegens NBRC 15636 = ATCC 14048 = DSM 759]UUI14431.1 low-specificity L-threonine aldolase [Vibrio natriegens]
MDFRSDTVTQPTQAMREAMFTAPVGDDVYGDDPTVNELEQYAAELAGFEAALFTTSGTQANLLGLMAHCDRGDEYLCGQQAHNYKYEAGGAAVLGSIQPQPIENNPDGTLPFDKLAAAIKPDDMHFARTRLLSLENTINGKVLPLTYLAEAREFVNQHNLKLHLDGARVFNAAVALDVPVKEIAQYFDSMTICLSKGLCAPVGSLLLGSKEYIAKARRLRKMVGGGMRQAGILAAAGKLAITEQVLQLKQDHINAKTLAQGLAELPRFSVNPDLVQTNIVFAKLDPQVDIVSIAEKLKQQDIIITPGNPIRFVTHKDISEQDVATFLSALKSIL